MPRKPLIYTPDFPYHITARTNNKEWFSISLKDAWEIFISELIELNQRYNFSIHAFVLMNNHYHLIASCSESYNLGHIMRILQSRTARAMNSQSGRVNHVYGRRYRASIIGDEFYYATALKYVYRNPVTAGICNRVENWKYSSVTSLFDDNYCELPISCNLLEGPLIKYESEPLAWLNDNFELEDYKKIQLGLTRSEFRLKGRSSPLRNFL